MRQRIALTLHGWSIKIGGPPFIVAIRQAVASQLRAEQEAAQLAATERQVRILNAHRQEAARRAARQ